MSLRGRLLLAVGTVALLALVAADLFTYSKVRSFLYQRVDQSLEDAHFPFEQALEGSRFGPTTTVITPGTFVEIRDASGVIVGDYGGQLRNGRQFTPALPAAITGFHLQSRPGEPVKYFTVESAEPGGADFRVRASVLSGGSQLIIAVGLGGTTATLHYLVKIELGVAAAALAAAAALGWWLVRVGLQPLSDVEATADAIAEGELDRRVPGDTANTEVGRLARALNTMLARIQDAFAQRDATEAELRATEERLRRFVADASHELRTPLAAVAAYAELFDRGASRRPEDLARVIAGIQNETGRMGELVEDLLLLARLDEGLPLKREPVELVALAAQAVDAAVAVGPAWPVRLEAARPVEVLGDAARLRQILDNLLANVRAHTPRGTSSVVRVADEHDDAVLSVVDDGPGLTPEQAARVFERFYRAEASRSRQHGGAGLGLSIVAAIAAAHGGRAEVGEGPGGGSRFTVRLPLAPLSDTREVPPMDAAAMPSSAAEVAS